MTVSPENGSVKSVVHVVNRYPPALGGMEKVVQALARAQCKLGVDVTVLTSDHGKDELPLEDEPFPVIRLKSSTVAHTQIMPGLFPRLLGLDRNAVLHVHVAAALLPELVWVYSKLRKHRYVASVHLDVPPSTLVGRVLLTPYKNLLLKRVLRDASAILVATDDYQELISDKYGIPRERVFPIGYGTSHRIVDQPKVLGPAGGPRKILFVGRLAAQKNVPALLDALSLYVRKYNRDVRLTLVGDGELRGELRAQVQRLGLADIVTFAGTLHGEALETAYQESDVLALTSTQESFGLVFIEAMTKGVPIVSGDLPAIRNVVENGVNGMLAQQNPESVADAIHTVLADPARYEQMSRNNLAKARTYDWDVVAAKIMAESYASVAG
jgi:glycosyltransferase involved in cell wall biosynthesis